MFAKYNFRFQLVVFDQKWLALEISVKCVKFIDTNVLVSTVSCVVRGYLCATECWHSTLWYHLLPLLGSIIEQPVKDEVH